MFILLIGPKGSGKSHIGRVLEARIGVHFFHVEPLWLEYYAECEASGRQPVIAEGIARVHPVLVRALDKHAHVCVETTGASPEILDALLSLRPRSEIIVGRVCAPLELCLQRVSNRDQTHQIPMEMETLRKVHALSESLQLRSDITLNNVQLTESEIMGLFESALTETLDRYPQATPSPSSEVKGQAMVQPPSTQGQARRYVYVWEFLVMPEREQEFLAAYGPSGAWSLLFRRAPGYIETLLLQDQATPGRFLTMDRWSSLSAHDTFRVQFQAEYETLDRACEAITHHEASLGSFWELGHPAV